MKSNPVYAVKDNKLYEYYYDYEINERVTNFIADDVALVSNYYDCKYYYMDTSGKMFYVCKDTVVALRTFKNIPVRINNIGKPMLVYSGWIIVLEDIEFQIEIVIDDAPTANISYADSEMVIIHHENYAILYRYNGKHEYISAQHFYIKNGVCFIGNYVSGKYLLSEGIIKGDQLIIVDTKEYDCEELQLIGSRFFTDGNNLFTFNGELKFLFALQGGEWYTENTVLHVKRCGKVYVEAESYNESIMINISD